MWVSGKGSFTIPKWHIYFFERDGGFFLVSRFWIGADLKNRLIRKVLFNEKTAKDMARHCCVEYRNFAAKIPSLYSEINNV